ERKSLSASSHGLSGGNPACSQRVLTIELLAGRGAALAASALLMGITSTLSWTIARANSWRLHAPRFTTWNSPRADARISAAIASARSWVEVGLPVWSLTTRSGPHRVDGEGQLRVGLGAVDVVERGGVDDDGWPDLLRGVEDGGAAGDVQLRAGCRMDFLTGEGLLQVSAELPASAGDEDPHGLVGNRVGR